MALTLLLIFLKTALLTKVSIVFTLIILFYTRKEVELNVIKLFKLILKEDIIALNEDNFNSNNK
jgi:hypothetical protein